MTGPSPKSDAMNMLDLETAAALQGGSSVALYDGCDAWRAPFTIITDEGKRRLCNSSIETPRTVCAELSDVPLLHGRSPVVGGVPIFLGMSHNGHAEQAAHAPDGEVTPSVAAALNEEGPSFPGAHFLVAGHSNNWWHLTYNFVLRLRALELAWPELAATVPLAVHADVRSSFLQIFELLGHRNPLVFFDRLTLPRFETLLVAETPVHLRPQQVAAAKDASAPLARLRRTGGRRRIYLSRRDAQWRRVANEKELMAELSPLGFENHELAGRSLEEIASFMSQADIVVGPSGANLAATMFCSPGTRIVELSPPAMTGKYWFTLASGMNGMPHWQIEGTPVVDPLRRPHAYDFVAPVAGVKALIDELLS